MLRILNWLDCKGEVEKRYTIIDLYDYSAFQYRNKQQHTNIYLCQYLYIYKITTMLSDYYHPAARLYGRPRDRTSGWFIAADAITVL